MKKLLNNLEDRIARVSASALCRTVSHNGNLSRKTKRMVYYAAVLGMWFYGAETWANRRVATREIESFNNKCLWRLLNITKA